MKYRMAAMVFLAALFLFGMIPQITYAQIQPPPTPVRCGDVINMDLESDEIHNYALDLGAGDTM